MHSSEVVMTSVSGGMTRAVLVTERLFCNEHVNTVNIEKLGNRNLEIETWKQKLVNKTLRIRTLCEQWTKPACRAREAAIQSRLTVYDLEFKKRYQLLRAYYLTFSRCVWLFFSGPFLIWYLFWLFSSIFFIVFDSFLPFLTILKYFRTFLHSTPTQQECHK